MSLTFKLLSLAIRTAAKPIGNYIKRQAKEHDGFRRFAISQAQRVHRIDMRMRLGILHDPAAQERMHEREAKAAEEKKRKAESPTVRSELEQKKHDEEQAKAEKEGTAKKKDEKSSKVKIRPLSDVKAIELGANFFSEAFIFAVAAGLLVWDSWRSRKKESERRDVIGERLGDLEAELGRLRSKYEPDLAVSQEKVKSKQETAWWNPAGWWARTDPAVLSDVPEGSIPGNVPGQGQGSATKTSAAPQKPTPKETNNNKMVEVAVKDATPVDKPAQERVDSVTAIKKER